MDVHNNGKTVIGEKHIASYELVSELASYNHFHKVLTLFNALPSFPFTTSKTMRDYYL